MPTQDEEPDPDQVTNPLAEGRGLVDTHENNCRFNFRTSKERKKRTERRAKQLGFRNLNDLINAMLDLDYEESRLGQESGKEPTDNWRAWRERIHSLRKNLSRQSASTTFVKRSVQQNTMNPQASLAFKQPKENKDEDWEEIQRRLRSL
jgi:hypothetical protein